MPFQIPKMEIKRYMAKSDATISILQARTAAQLVKSGKFTSRASAETVAHFVRELAFKPFGLGFPKGVPTELDQNAGIDPLSLFNALFGWAQLYSTNPYSLHPKYSTAAVASINRELAYLASPAHGFLFTLLLEAAQAVPRPMATHGVLSAWAIRPEELFDTVRMSIARVIQAQAASIVEFSRTNSVTIQQVVRQLVRLEGVVRNYAHRVAKIQALPINSFQRISALNGLALEVFNLELDASLALPIVPIASSRTADMGLTPWQLKGSVLADSPNRADTQHRLASFTTSDGRSVSALFGAFDAYREHAFLTTMPLTSPVNMARASALFVEDLFTPEFIRTLNKTPIPPAITGRESASAISTAVQALLSLGNEEDKDLAYATLGQAISQYTLDAPISEKSITNAGGLRAAMWTMRLLSDYTRSSEQLQSISDLTINTYLGRIAEKVLLPLVGPDRGGQERGFTF